MNNIELPSQFLKSNNFISILVCNNFECNKVDEILNSIKNQEGNVNFELIWVIENTNNEKMLKEKLIE